MQDIIPQGTETRTELILTLGVIGVIGVITLDLGTTPVGLIYKILYTSTDGDYVSTVGYTVHSA